MADIGDMVNQSEFNKPPLPPEIIPPTEAERKRIEKEKRQKAVDDQLHGLFKNSQRPSPPSPKELKELITKYFNDVFPENYALYTLHVFLGMTEDNIASDILPVDELKEIYNFAIEKFKAKGEITMHVAGRSTDSFYMQNIAKWRKKDPEEVEQASGLAELHRGVKEYKDKKSQV